MDILTKHAISYDKRAFILREKARLNPQLRQNESFRRQCNALEKEGMAIVDKMYAQKFRTPEQLSKLSLRK